MEREFFYFDVYNYAVESINNLRISLFNLYYVFKTIVKHIRNNAKTFSNKKKKLPLKSWP